MFIILLEQIRNIGHLLSTKREQEWIENVFLVNMLLFLFNLLLMRKQKITGIYRNIQILTLIFL
jgi:hypothetical protein